MRLTRILSRAFHMTVGTRATRNDSHGPCFTRAERMRDARAARHVARVFRAGGTEEVSKFAKSSNFIFVFHLF